MKSGNALRIHPLGTFVAVAAVAMLATACGGGASDGGAAAGPDPALVARGETLFMQTCATCHGRDAAGLPNLGKSLLANEFVAGHDDKALIDFVKTGRPAFHELNTTGIDMPPKGGNPTLTDEDIAAIVAYVRSLQ